ncbi:MAG: tungstate transporter permease [Candidatus Aquicultor secundus]|uniref:Tungstate transporter permease n=1 Tax=Candidatus Aquicultor secundus TaxID=1973895 RepID=A0A2M7T9X3_9ACTN|nr:ABC transporter permease [Candidatus Aquicultor secundus]NCO66470.1 ABC transporter permease subunit [Solirubrobacter sp.]OIO88465.1 MAG: tungstate transporter permease [Candidatus Aquicultor secundus]PIU26914.1 MAG: tungstate transporter permease [Candidatus Aquicultor secundus]PIW22847.1 MAG: tungstate transporter permease [Candidatus Aquicultor secundus]PIX52948.1 MAG: tungstate transporter permease [Candidatus Aquicultor secundus]
MELLIDGLKQAFILIVTGDSLVVEATLRSLETSGSAIVISLVLGIPIGLLLALTRFPGRSFVVALFNAGMGLPPVVVGLFVALFLWRSGVLGFMGLMYTLSAMVIAQVIIAMPLVTGLTVSAIQQLNPKLRLQSLALGATKSQMVFTLIKEAKLTALAAVIAGFGAVISEVGAVMMVGGNISGQTRVLTTAIVELVGKGDFSRAMALSFILLAVTFAATYALTHYQQKGTAIWRRIS